MSQTSSGSGTTFQISGVDRKEDRMELELTSRNRYEGRLKAVLDAEWQNQMTNDAVILVIKKFVG
jgi:hypothetical protein